MLQRLRSWYRHLVRSDARVTVPQVWQNQEHLAESSTSACHAVDAASLRRLRQVVLSDRLCRTLLEGYQEHLRSGRGHLETAWILLGRRQQEQALALAALPAGARSDAGVAHVRIHGPSHAVFYRILKQFHRDLDLIGIVHTHPGALHHPSSGDYEGDADWVRQLRGQEGIFGIGTHIEAERTDGSEDIATQPEAHILCYGDVRFDWYALARGDANYRPLPLQILPGPDWATPLRPHLSTIEQHAERIERLCQQLRHVRFELTSEAVLVSMRLPDEAGELKVRLTGGERPQYFLARGRDWLPADTDELRIDRAVYNILAALTPD